MDLGTDRTDHPGTDNRRSRIGPVKTGYIVPARRRTRLLRGRLGTLQGIQITLTQSVLQEPFQRVENCF